jgi:hypothetical protein
LDSNRASNPAKPDLVRADLVFQQARQGNVRPLFSTAENQIVS